MVEGNINDLNLHFGLSQLHGPAEYGHNMKENNISHTGSSGRGLTGDDESWDEYLAEFKVLCQKII